MGRKHKHSKDKLYKTVSELNSHHIGANRDLELSHLHRRLKFSSCCLTLDTIRSKPVGLLDGTGFCYMFDEDNLIKFILKYKVHPITGQPISTNELIPIIFHMNQDQYQCPITMKPLNQYSKIVVNRKTGNVFSHEAYHRFNLMAKDFKDLISGQPFEKSDIVTIQDPSLIDDKWDVTKFYHIINKLKLTNDEEDRSKDRSKDSNIIESTLAEYKQQQTKAKEVHERLFGRTKTDEKEIGLNKTNRANYSDGKLSTSVTSTVMQITNCQVPAVLTHDQVLYPRIKKKGYVEIQTNHGAMKVELYCQRTPKTCHNFLILAAKGYYDQTLFHRLIKNFMIQGGDPTGTGKGGQSAWGGPFNDELHGDLKHIGGGVLAMANSGPNSNKSQFYITLKGDWTHLNGKHTIFGRVIEGQHTLRTINEVPVDKNDRPTSDIKIEQIKILEDPYVAEQKAIDLVNNKKRDHDESDKSLVLKKYRSGIGSYIDIESKIRTIKSLGDRPVTDIDTSPAPNSSKSTTTSSNYGDFSNW